MPIVKWGILGTVYAPGPANGSAGDQSVVAALPNGSYSVIWRDVNTGTVRLQIYNAAGIAQFQAPQTITNAGGQAIEADIVVLDDGNFVVSWSSASSTIYAQKFTIAGTPVGDPVVVENPANNHNGSFPAMATRGSDGWVTVWVDSRSNAAATDTIRFTRHNADGTYAVSNVISENDISNPDVVELANGNYVVTWATASGHIRATILKADGTPVDPLNPVITVDLDNSRTTSITALSDGGFVIAFKADGGAVFVREYSADGAAQTTAPVEIAGVRSGYAPQVVALTKGGFAGGYAIVYHSDFNGNQIFIRLVKANGEVVGPELVSGAGAGQISSVTELADGRISIIWDDPSLSPSGGVRHQIIDAREEVVTVNGTDGADFYIGTDLVDKGTDILKGNGGNDTLWGGNGNDKLIGGVGADSLVGGNGQDTVTYEDAVADANGVGVKVYFLNPGDNYGEAAGDSYSSIEVIDGSAHKDTIEGGTGNDTFWGANGDDLLKGFAGNDKLMGGNGSDTFYGGAGADTFEGGDDGGWDTVTYEFTNVGVVIDLTNTDNNQGEAIGDSYSGIEAFIGSQGHDTIRGYADEVNSFLGKAGNDSLVGGNLADALSDDAGNDILQGGLGADNLVGGEGADFASYADATGPVRADLHDAASNTGAYAQGDTYFSDDPALIIEGLIGSNFDDTLVGSEFDTTLIGGAGNDQLRAFDGNNILQGGLGEDQLVGGLAFDFASYASATAGVTVNLGLAVQPAGTGEAAGDSFTSIEGLIGSAFGDSLIGNDANNHLKGEGGNDGLTGGGGTDTLEGGAGDDVLNGGAGADRLEGGIGSDTYYVTAGDRIVEHAGQGTDTVVITSDFVVTGNDFANIENIILDISTLNNTLTGSETDNVLTGNDAGNRLEGLGGNDTLYGLGGNDGLFGGAGDDALFGGAGIDALFGDAGNDILDGGTGIDAMDGGVGNDVYYVNDAGDSVVEAAGGGIDTVYASVNFNMGAGTEVEYLYATGAAGLILTGSNFANTIIGNAGANKIYGGLGNDFLTGGAGKDIFVFDTKPNKRTNVDRIMDFIVRDDSFHLDNKYFTKLGSGTASKPKKFNSDMFVINNKAKDREDRVVYDKKTGALYYDQDGTGSKAQIKIATLNKNLKLTYSDFFVI